MVYVSNRSRNKPRSGIGTIKVTDWTKNWWLEKKKIYSTCMEPMSVPMKLYFSPGPKQTKRTCWMMDPERFPYIVTWPVKGLMHAEEVDGRWSWRSMAQRCLKIIVFTSSLICHHLISFLKTKLQCKSRVKVKR